MNPLTGLDIQSAQTIDDIIHDEPARGCSVVFTTHDLEEARAADHVILVSGYVVASGPPEHGTIQGQSRHRLRFGFASPRTYSRGWNH
jgi:manganese transport system ATP-binding protein